ncbi:hypothetical protein ACR6C2_07840 [Streptomyces sp. INA 01156]
MRQIKPYDSSADLLRAIHTLANERVGAPWTVLEEVSAQQAVKYREKYTKVAQAIEELKGVTPWPLDFEVGEDQLDDVRRYWRAQWLAVVEEVPTSENALRQAAYREANILPVQAREGRRQGRRS